MKTSKRILSIVLAVMLLVGAVVVGVSADTTMVYEKTGSKLVYTAEASKAANADGVIELEPGETITVSVYAQANYYLGTTGSEIFCWTAGFFNTFTEANVTLHNYVNQYTPNKKVIASTAASQLGTGYNKGTHEGYLYGRKYNSDYTSPYDASTATLGYTFTFTVPETATIGATGEFRMPETCSATVATTSRQIAIYAAVNNSDSAYGSSSLGSLYPETIDLTGTILNFKVVSAEPADVPCNYTALDAAIAAAATADTTDCTEASVTEFTAALAAANAVARDLIVDAEGANQKLIDDATARLNAAITGLTKLGACDYTALDAAIAAYEAKLADKALYANWAGYETYYDEAKAVARDMLADEDGVNQTIIDDATDNLNNYVLTYKAADYTAVDAAKAAANAVDASKYTEASVKAVNDAVDAVVTGYDITKQAEVDAMAKAINDAIDALVALGACDYTALDAAIADYDAKLADKALYANWAGYEAYYDEAKAVARDMLADEDGVNQTIIDDAADNLNNYVLTYKAADYSAVEAAKATIPADLSIYTPATVKPVNDAVAAVVEGYDITKQAEVDAMAAAIEDAVAKLVLKADKAALAAAIARISALDEADYTPDSWAAADIDSAILVAEEVYLNEDAPQTIVDGMVSAIERAEAKLVKKADKAALAAAIAAAKDLDEADYTPDSWAAADLAAAITAAEAVNADDNATDAAVADAIAALEAAAAKLAEKADKAALKAAIDTLPDVAEDEATSASWEAYEDALADANAVYADANATQDDVNAAEANLLAAIAAVKSLDACDYTALDAAIATTPEYDEEYYDADAWAAYEEALAAAEDVERDMLADEAGVNQAKIDAAAQALTDAYNALGEPKFVDRTALENALALSPEYGEAYYDEDTWAAWEEAVTNGTDTYEGVEGEPDVDWARDEVASAAQAIIDALAGLQLKAADYSAVDAAIAAANAVDASKYTEASVKAVNDAVDAVVTGYDITKQAEVDAMAKAINDAIDALVALGACDYTALDAAIADYDAKLADKDLYTNWAGYEAFYNEAKAVARDMLADEDGVNQTIIDDAADNLNNYVLTYKAADYSAVDAAKDAAAAIDADKYTEASVKAVNDAVAAVVTGYDITKQAEVDAMAKAINDAIDALVALGNCDYTALDAAIADYDAKLADKDLYTNWAGYEAFYNEAKAVARDMLADEDGVNQTIIDDATDNLNNYVLTYKAADYSAVDAAIEAANAVDASKYTEASVKAVNDAVAAVVTGYDITKQAEVDAMAKAINDAIDALVALGNCDYTALDAAIAAYEAKVADKALYSNWAEYEAAYNAAKAVARDMIADEAGVNQKTIDDATAALNAVVLIPIDAIVTNVTPKQEYFKVGDVVEYDFLCSTTGVTKLQVVYSSGTTSTYTRTHTSVTKITDNGDGTETWTIAIKIIGDTVPAKAKAKLGKVWEKNGYPFVFQTKQNPATLEDKEIKSVEIINANGEVVDMFKAKETVTIRIVAGPDTLRIRTVSEGGSTSTYTRTSAYQLDNGNWVWELKTSKTTLKTYKYDLHTAGKNNKLTDEGTDLVYTVVSAVPPAGPSTGDTADIVVSATVAKARLLVGDTQTVTVVTDKDALGVRIITSGGSVPYQTKDTSVAVDNGDGTLTWTFNVACGYAATYTYEVQALYRTQWMTNGTSITYRVVY